MATLYLKAAGGNWSAAGTWSATGSGGVDSAGPPTAADDVILEAGSGNLTINAAAVCRSLDCTSGAGSYAGTVTHNASVGLTIGDATAGAGNVALRFAAGMTYTASSPTTSTITYVSTSATQQTVTAAGKTQGNWTVNAPGGSYLLSDASTTGATSTVTLTAGTLNTNGQSCTWGIFNSVNSNVRTLTLGASSITITGSSWTFATATNATLNAGTSTITFSVPGTINTGLNLSYNNIVFSNVGSTSTFTSSGGIGTGTIANLTLVGAATTTQTFFLNAHIVISGTLTASGANSTSQRLLITSNTTSQVQTTVNGSLALSNVDFRRVIGLGTVNWNISAISGNSGDAGANVGITFTAPATQTWQGTAGGNWSDVSKWTSRVPLPQDDVVINAAFVASQTITADMSRIGKNISFVGISGNPSLANTTTTIDIHGSLTLANDMTLGLTGTVRFFCVTGASITSAGKTWTAIIGICSGHVSTVSGYIDLADPLTTTAALQLGSGVLTGRLRSNGYAITCSNLVLGNGSLQASELLVSGSTVTLTSTSAGNIVDTITTTQVVTAVGTTFVIANASANTRTFAGLGQSFGTLTYTVAGSTGQLMVTGSNRFDTINFSDVTNARTLAFAVGTTNTVRKFNVQGTVGNLMTVRSVTGGSAMTLQSTAPRQSCDYLSIQDSSAIGGSWYAGVNSTNVSGNTGWIFTPPSVGAGGFLMLTQ